MDTYQFESIKERLDALIQIALDNKEKEKKEETKPRSAI